MVIKAGLAGIKAVRHYVNARLTETKAGLMVIKECLMKNLMMLWW